MKRFLGILFVCMIVISSFIGILSLIPTNVNAAGPTYVSGPITSNTTWTAANSPYIVQSDVLVTNGTLLTIDPGVIVKFDGLYSLIVNGTLNATGTSGQPILFTSNQSSPTKGDWNRVRLHGKNNTMDYCKIQYGNYQLYIMGNNTNNIISHCKIENGSGDGVYLKETSNNTLSDLLVSYCNSNGITVLMSDYNLIKNCFSHHNKAFGIYLRTATNNTIINSNSSKNNGGGYELSLKSHYNTLKNVKVFGNQDNGVDFCGNGFNTILDSEIVGNNVNGIDMGGKAEKIWIENCIITNNGEAGIDLKSSSFSDIINCEIIQNQGEAGIYSGSSVSHINITSSKVWDNFDDGIEIYEADFVNINNSNISENTWNGIIFNGSETQENNIIQNCTISENGNNGIYLYAYSYSKSDIQNNKIQLNSIFSNNQNGIYLYSYVYYYTTQNYYNSYVQYNIIYNNTIYSNNQNGIYLKAFSDDYNWYQSSYIEHNNINHNTVYSNDQNGIYLEAYTENRDIYIQNNNIHNNTIYSNIQNGINIYANTDWEESKIKNNNINNNIIYLNNQNGIYFSTNPINRYIEFEYNNIHLNTIYLNSKNGIYLYCHGEQWSHFYFNSIYNNIIYSNNQNGIYIYSHCDYKQANIQYNNIHSNIIHLNDKNGIYFFVDSEATSYYDYWHYSYFQDNNIYLNTIYSNNQSGINFYGKTKNGFLYFQNNEIYSNTIYFHNNSCGIYGQSDNCSVTWQSSNLYKNTLNSNLIGIKFLRIKSHITYINNITNSSGDGILLEDSTSNTFGYNKIVNNNWCGINLTSNSKTNKIQNNNISYNNQTGVFINSNSDSNTVTRNDIYSNYLLGMNVSSSMSNMMHHNNFKLNTKSAHDTTVQLNSWDDGIEGNWWDDYTGFDANNDGIGDIPYDVPGGGSKDWYPIIKPANITAPHVESTIPANGVINISVNPKISITFSNKMNQSATESAISMASGAGGETIWNFTWSNGDLTVAFEPLFTLSSTTKYTVTITIAAKDVLNNNLEQNYQFSFTTKDIIPPTITLTSPISWTTDVALNTLINVTFSEPMNCSTVIFTCSPDPGGWGVAWSSMNMFASFSHTDFGSSTIYTFKITVAKDMSGNDLVSGSKPNPWYFTTVDVVGPEITTTSPANGSTGVLLGANVVVTFSEQMDTTSVTFTCSPDPGGWSVMWTNSDKTVTFSHNAFTDETTYTFHITAGKDKQNNALNPSLPNPWNFRTVDATPPKITVTSPINGSVNILLNAKIIVIFDEEMNTASVTHICNPNPDGWTVAWSGTNTVATYSHNSFNEQTSYVFQITGGKDITGNNMVASTVPNPWSFTTIDLTAPQLTATMPVNGSIDITLNANIVVTFSEAMDTKTVAYTCSPNPGGWVVTWSVGNTIATYTHNLFASFTNYTFQITAAKDLAGNDLLASPIPNPWTFKTRDALSPSIISTFPEDGSTNVAMTANVVVGFSEKMDTSTVTFICEPNPAGWEVVWSAGDTIATFMHDPFERFITYSFQISDGLDLGGNNLVAGSVSNPFTFGTVDNIPPTILSDPIETATEDIQYLYNIEAFDSNDDILTYQLTSYPTGMTFNTSSGLVSWTPTNELVGTHPVAAIVSDGNGGIDTQSFMITVENVNDAPNITSIPVTIGTEDTKYNYDVEAYDIDAGDTLSYSVVSGPTDMVIDDSSGLITWIPTNDQVGANHVTVKVTDKYNGVATQPFTITVENVNDPPTIISTPVTSATEDRSYTYNVRATDIDPTEDVLTFSLNTYPPGMELDPATGELTWTPINDQVGSNNVGVIVSDGNDGTDTQLFTIDVTNVNDPPLIISTPPTTAVEDEKYVYDVDAMDFDIGDTLTYGLDNYPDGMVIDSETGIITWTPTNEQVGASPVTANVIDGGGEKAQQSFTITVTNVNDEPSITSIPVTTAAADNEYVYDVEAEDIDLLNDVLTFSLTTSPTGMEIDPATGVITWTPNEEQVGENAVVVVVEDGNGGTALQSFTITVDSIEPVVDEEKTEKDSVEQLVLLNILMLIIIIVLIVLLFMFVLKPKKSKTAEIEEDKPKMSAPLEEQPAPQQAPPQRAQLHKLPPQPQATLQQQPPKPRMPPVPQLKSQRKPQLTIPMLPSGSEAPSPKIKSKVQPSIPKIKSKPEAPVPKIRLKTTK